MYNKFDPKHYKGKWYCTIKTLYNEKTLIGRLHQYFLIYFETFSVPTADTLFLLILSILALESAHSIRFLYQHFLSGVTEKSLNVFYYACSYARIDSAMYAFAFCHFREKYRNTYKIKFYDKGFKTADSLASLSFIKL